VIEGWLCERDKALWAAGVAYDDLIDVIFLATGIRLVAGQIAKTCQRLRRLGLLQFYTGQGRPFAERQREWRDVQRQAVRNVLDRHFMMLSGWRVSEAARWVIEHGHDCNPRLVAECAVDLGLHLADPPAGVTGSLRGGECA